MGWCFNVSFPFIRNSFSDFRDFYFQFLVLLVYNIHIQTDRNGNIVPIKNQSPKQRIDGTAALLDCYVGLYEHYNEYTSAI